AAVRWRSRVPIEGQVVVRVRRSIAGSGRDRCSGRGKHGQALGITVALDAHPLDAPPLFFLEGGRVPPSRIVTCTRVGITRAHDLPLRFYERGNPHVSRW